jgi:ubiquinone/menaquinone biosynthesis C-methylase UbiE
MEMAKTEDLIMEWLSLRLPFGGGKAHERIIEDSLKGVNTVLDLGCGRGTFKILRKFVTTGVDIYPENISRARDNGNYQTLVQGDVREIKFPDKSFDAVICIELIEHLNKEEGRKLLDNIEWVARKVIVITTPWGFDALPKRKDNPFLDHQSGWIPQEFIERGYEVIPIMSIRWHLGNNPFLLIIAYCLSVCMRPLIKWYPSKLCNNFAAVKREM